MVKFGPDRGALGLLGREDVRAGEKGAADSFHLTVAASVADYEAEQQGGAFRGCQFDGFFDETNDFGKLSGIMTF